MVKRIFKWLGIVIGALVLIVIATYAFIHFNIERRIHKTYSFTPDIITIPTDSTSIAKGRHLVSIKGCTDCHGGNMAGTVMINDFSLGRLSARNLTRGAGGLAAGYSTADWMRALQHGIDKSGKPLLFMPAHETSQMTRDDLAAIIAYCNQMEPVKNELPGIKLGPVTRIMTFLDKMPLLSVEKIDHKRTLTATVDSNNALVYGSYLAVTCTGCHKADFRGGEPVAPGFPVVPNITAGGHVGQWSQDQFMHTLRTGERPGNKPLDNEYMPWKMTAKYSTKELVSIYTYLRSLK
jgi:cytochrome c553